MAIAVSFEWLEKIDSVIWSNGLFYNEHMKTLICTVSQSQISVEMKKNFRIKIKQDGFLHYVEQLKGLSKRCLRNMMSSYLFFYCQPIIYCY